jgi:hypothetical protein
MYGLYVEVGGFIWLKIENSSGVLYESLCSVKWGIWQLPQQLLVSQE